MEKAVRESSIRTRLGKFQIGNACLKTEYKDCSSLCMWAIF